jgi:hypothetical protein
MVERAPAVSFGTYKTEDDVLEDVGSVVPGFGGLYYDQNPLSVVVYLTDPDAQSAGAANSIRSALKGRRGVLEAARYLPIKFRRGRFTFKQLAQWHRALNARGLPDGMAFTGIDKATNTLTLGVRSDAARSALIGLLTAIGAPADAFSIETVTSTEVNANLTDRRRPTIGGIQTGRVGPCTLGANARPPFGTSPKYLLSVSHCTELMVRPDTGTWDWFQSSPVPGDVVGREVSDPAPFTGGTCPAGKVCRYGDAALIQYNNPSDAEIGTIAMADASGTINGFANMTVRYASVIPYYKTGIATGTTEARVVTYCVNYFPDPAAYAAQGHPIPSNLVILCQNRFTGGFLAGPGDSGGPVFTRGLDCGDPPPEEPGASCLYRFDIAKFIGVYHATTTVGSTKYHWVSVYDHLLQYDFSSFLFTVYPDSF